MELTDIGGVTLLRAAAKNHTDGVVVVYDVADRQAVVAELAERGSLSLESRRRLAAKGFKLITLYDGAIRKFLSGQEQPAGEVSIAEHTSTLAYGENRYQSPAELLTLHTNDPLALDCFTVVSGEPSFISMADLDSAMQVLCLIAEAFRRIFDKAPHIAVVCKHGDPCGCAFSWLSQAEALRKCMFGDPLAVMGGELVCNFSIGAELAESIHVAPEAVGREKWGLDLIAAPVITDEAVEVLGGRSVKPRRLLTNPALGNPQLPDCKTVLRSVRFFTAGCAGLCTESRAPQLV